MGDATPPNRSRARPWYEYRPESEGKGPFAVYTREEWQPLVDKAKAISKADQLAMYQECLDEYDAYLNDGLKGDDKPGTADVRRGSE